VTHPIDTATIHNRCQLEQELRDQLSHESGTARRQELLKALWKLSQRRDDTGSSVPEDNAMAGSTSLCLSKAKALESESLSVSC
jgi:hypothetical protein